MNYKKKRLLFSFFLILVIQFLLLTNNRQKTSFRYFIWNTQDVSIGRLIVISFLSGLIMSSILNKTLNFNSRNNPLFEEDEKILYGNDNSIDTDNNEPYEMTPERDLRDPQPTISVNYRVIKNNGDNELKERDQIYNNSQYEDDWSKNNSEW